MRDTLSLLGYVQRGAKPISGKGTGDVPLSFRNLCRRVGGKDDVCYP